MPSKLAPSGSTVIIQGKFILLCNSPLRQQASNIHLRQYPYGLRSPLIVRSADEPAYYGYDAQSDYVMDVTDNVSI